MPISAGQIEATVGRVRELMPPEVEIVPVSATTGEGLPRLLATLRHTAAAIDRKIRFDSTRLYVDRVFSLPGAGTVATGTLWSGSIATGNRLQVLPAGFEARVRSVQVHGETVERAEAGQRVAVGLVGERRNRLERGAALVHPGAYRSSLRVDVALEEVTSVPRVSRAHVCHGSSAVLARVVRVGDDYAQLRARAAT